MANELGIIISGGHLSISGTVNMTQSAPTGDPEVILGTIDLVEGLNTNFPDQPVSSGVFIQNVINAPGGNHIGGSGSNAPFKSGSIYQAWSYNQPFPVTNLNQMTAFASQGSGKIIYSAIYIS